MRIRIDMRIPLVTFCEMRLPPVITNTFWVFRQNPALPPHHWAAILMIGHQTATVRLSLPMAKPAGITPAGYSQWRFLSPSLRPFFDQTCAVRIQQIL